jgi:hypothetical protein
MSPGEITIWDAASGKELLALKESVSVHGAALTSGGGRLETVVSVGQGLGIKAWDAKPRPR